MRDSARGTRHHFYGFSHIGGFDDREASNWQCRFHEWAVSRFNSNGLVVAHLHGLACNAHQHAGFLQSSVMCVGCISDSRWGTVVAVLVSISDGHELRHEASPLRGGWLQFSVLKFQVGTFRDRNAWPSDSAYFRCRDREALCGLQPLVELQMVDWEFVLNHMPMSKLIGRGLSVDVLSGREGHLFHFMTLFISSAV